MVERKFDWKTTKAFNLELSHLCLDEYELEMLFTSIDRFCASIDKSTYKSARYHNKIYYEIEIPLFTRRLIIFSEIEGIDALMYKIKEY